MYTTGHYSQARQDKARVPGAFKRARPGTRLWAATSTADEEHNLGGQVFHATRTPGGRQKISHCQKTCVEGKIREEIVAFFLLVFIIMQLVEVF